MRSVACALVVGLALVAGPVDSAVGLAQASAPDPARAQRLDWFRAAKYGMFIHWGLYAIPAGEYNGRRAPGIGEWIMNRLRIPVAEYEQFARQFNPVKFN